MSPVAFGAVLWWAVIVDGLACSLTSDGRSVRDAVFTFGGTTGGEDADRVYMLNGTQATVWTNAPPMPQDRWSHASAVVDNKVYVVGGSQIDVAGLNSLNIFDPATNTWTVGADKPGIESSSLAAAGFDGNFYVFGGYGSYEKAYVYTPSNNSWSVLPDIPHPRRGAAAATFGRKIYLFGGANFIQSNNVYANVDVYDPDSRTWGSAANLPTPRQKLAAATLGDWIYVAGGELASVARTGIVERYSPAENRWETVSPLNKARSFFALAAGQYPPTLYAVAGLVDSPRTGWVESYDVGLNTWSQITPLPSPRYYLTAEVVVLDCIPSASAGGASASSETTGSSSSGTTGSTSSGTTGLSTGSAAGTSTAVRVSAHNGWPKSIVCNHDLDEFCYLGMSGGLPPGAGSSAIVRFFHANLSIGGVIALKPTEYDAGQLALGPGGEHLFALTRNGNAAPYRSPSTIVRVNVDSFSVVGRTPFGLQAWTRISSSRIVNSPAGVFGFAASDVPPGSPSIDLPFDTVYLARFGDVNHPKTLTTHFTVPETDVQSIYNPAGSRTHVVDPNGAFVVFCLTTLPIWLVKVDIVTWNIVATLRIADAPSLSSHVMGIEPTGTYAFVTTQTFTGYGTPGVDSATYKIRLSDLTIVSSVRVAAAKGSALSMVFEPTGTHGYFGYGPLGHILKVRLSDLSEEAWLPLFDVPTRASPAAATVDPSNTGAIFASVNEDDGKVYLTRLAF